LNTLIVIPARYQSSRLPGKPLLSLAGQTMIERVWRIASSIEGVGVCIATDDQRIAEEASRFGAQVQLTDPECRNGSERCWDAVQKMSVHPEIIVNLQGDCPLLPPQVLRDLLQEMKQDSALPIATPAFQLTQQEYRTIAQAKAAGSSSGTFVTFNARRDALYFSSALIPFLRGKQSEIVPVYRHIGVYAYRYSALERYLQLPPGAFEQIEQLEQLRALEHGIPIRVTLVDLQGRSLASVDNPEDVQAVEAIIYREGELLA
jgi:3-deoxy-manno-octulosonate cytidylyltransferase (CMP-KDO synthetase)